MRKAVLIQYLDINHTGADPCPRQSARRLSKLINPVLSYHYFLPDLRLPATVHHRLLAGTKLDCLATEARGCEPLAQSRYTATPGLEIKPITTRLQVQCPTHWTTAPCIKTLMNRIWRLQQMFSPDLLELLSRASQQTFHLLTPVSPVHTYTHNDLRHLHIA